jgi:hypothetical protein
MTLLKIRNNKGKISVKEIITEIIKLKILKKENWIWILDFG